MPRVRSLVAAVAAVVVTGSWGIHTAGAASQDARELTPREQAFHVLNRLAFGPRPGDVDRVVTMGVDRWVEQQLRPDRVPDRDTD